MKDFGEWFNNPIRREAPQAPTATSQQSSIEAARETLESLLPDGISMRFYVPCRVCGKKYEWPVEPELYEDGENNYCGGSPSCCP